MDVHPDVVMYTLLWWIQWYGIFGVTFLPLSPQGKFQGLDLNEELHVGGYPNYTLIAKTAGIKTGFVGKASVCYLIQHVTLTHSAI